MKIKNKEKPLINFIRKNENGFYTYQIIIGKKAYEVDFKPEFVPYYNACVNDMLKREDQGQRAPVMAVEDVIKRMKASIEKHREKKKEKKENLNSDVKANP